MAATPGNGKTKKRDVQEERIKVAIADRVYMAGRFQHLAQPDIHH